MEVSLITNGIKISVEHHYRSDLSCPPQYKFIFAYAVTIENLSPNTVRLMRRHWFIHDSCVQMREVTGDGVVGYQPVLAPGKQYRYESWSNLVSDIGKMYGFYTFVSLKDGCALKIPIPEFKLIAPCRLN
jgi:ApaG protein